MNLEDYVKNNIKEIISMALSSVSDKTDGIVYYNTLKKEFFTSSNNFIGWENILEVYRLHKGFNKEKYMSEDCMYCDWLYDCDNYYAIDEKGADKILTDCTINKLADEFKTNGVELVE